jgi:hypothetical protein
MLRLGGTGEDAEAAILGKLCVEVAGFNMHANMRVGANDRDGLEHLCRYLARPPIANDRLQKLPSVGPAIPATGSRPARKSILGGNEDS